MTCLQDGTLDYFYHFVCLPHELDQKWNTWLAQGIIRVFLVSNRFLTTFCTPSSNNIDAINGTFRLNGTNRTYFAEDPITLARLATVAMRRAHKLAGFSISFLPETEPETQQKLAKLLYWGKKRNVGFALNQYFAPRVLNQVWVELDLPDLYPGRYFQDFRYFYGVEPDDLKSASITSRSLNVNGGKDVSRELWPFSEKNRLTTRPYLRDILRIPATHLILINCDVFVMHQYLPLSPKPELEYLKSNITLNTICSDGSHDWYHELVVGILQAAPQCTIDFELNASVLVANYETHLDVLKQFFVAVDNMKRLQAEFPIL